MWRNLSWFQSCVLFDNAHALAQDTEPSRFLQLSSHGKVSHRHIGHRAVVLHALRSTLRNRTITSSLESLVDESDKNSQWQRSWCEEMWRKGYKKWTDTVKVGKSFNTKEAKAAAVARRGTEKASATVATMATRKQVQEALQRKKEGARSRRAMPSSVAKSTKTNELKKVRFMVPPEVPRDARMSIEDLANFDEPDVDELERDGLHRALRSALETQVLVCADEWLSVFTDYVGRLGNEQEAELFEAEKSLPADKELEQHV